MLASLTSTALTVAHIAIGVAASSPVLFDGCIEVGPGPVCTVDSGSTLTLWQEQPASNLGQPFFNDHKLSPDAVTSTDGGTRFTLALPAAKGTLTLRDADTEPVLQLHIRPATEDAARELAQRALNGRSHDEALAALNAALAAASPAERTEFLRTKARLHTRRDEHTLAQGIFRAAIDSARTHGQHYSAVKSAAALAFSLRQHQRDTQAAQQVMEEIWDLVGAHGSSRYLWLYHRGMVAFTADNTREQLDFLERAVSMAKRTDHAVRELRADTILAVVQQSLGQRKAAGARLESWSNHLPKDLPGCPQAVFWGNLGWNALLELEAQERSVDPVPIFEKALALSDMHCATTNRVNLRLNLGLSYWHRGELDRAQAYLNDAQSLTQEPATQLTFWAMDLDGRIRASRGDYDGALERYSLLAKRAAASARPGTTWRAFVRRAWVLRLAGRHAEAIDMHRAAERALDEQVLRVPVHAGRESLLATRRFAMREHLSLLHNQQRFSEALALMQRERRRVIEQLHIASRITQLDGNERAAWERYRQQYDALRSDGAAERATSWQLSRAQLDALEQRNKKRERQLQTLLDQGVSTLYKPTIQTANIGAERFNNSEPLLGIWRATDRWSVLLANDDGVQGVSPDCPEDLDRDMRDSVAACLMQSVATQLDDAEGISLLLDDTLADVDWHALPNGNTQWIDQLAIRYVSGLPTTTRAIPGPGIALIVGDPGGNLQAARDEVRDVQGHLRERREWRADTLLGELADRSAIRSRLANAALFHYAGHAVFGDNSGWDSALLLANNTRLSIGDILTLEATPRLVVLSGCETALSAGVTSPAMSLANAFLARGSSTVVATTRSVDDRSARAVVSAFYDHWLAGQPVHHALRTAQRRTRDEQPDLDWSAFRIIEP